MNIVEAAFLAGIVYGAIGALIVVYVVFPFLARIWARRGYSRLDDDG
jgi:uncharacterized protein (DUF2062 family)